MSGTEKMGQTIALWSTDYSEISGQGLVTRRVVEKVLPNLGRVKQFVFRPSGRPTAVLSWLSAVLSLWWEVIFRRIDTLYLVCSRSNAGFLRDIPALLISRVGVRIVVHVHGSDIVSLLGGRRISPLARIAYHKCELIVPSEHLVPALSEFSLGAVHVCENFAPHTGPAPDPVPASKATFTLLWNSNVMASKGAFDVMEAVKVLRADGVDIELLAIGTVLQDTEMSAARALSTLTAYLGNGSMTYLGRVSVEAAAALVYAADAIALPSRYSCELQPLALIQAMAAGKAVIVSDIPALTATLAGYPAEVVLSHSIEAIVSALRRLIDDKAAAALGFVADRTLHAKKARLRFDPASFDRNLTAILVASSANESSSMGGRRLRPPNYF